MKITEKPNLQQAIIKPFTKGHGRIEVSQARMYDPRRMGGLGAWGSPLIEWLGETTATAEQVEQFIAALQEALRIYNEWNGAQ